MAKEKENIDDNIFWYKDAIIYELHIKAFADSNGDGIGDFQGLLEKLDYLEDLGVTAIWLLPFYPSPLRDDGYDIADYYSINPSYGKISDFKRFLREAHKRNLKVITELVINHTSDQHPWFQRAREAKKDSVYRDYYVWSDDPNKYKDVRIIFKDFESSNWTWDPVAKSYYWHRFYSHQPDLNYDNPKVQKEVFKILDYWLKMGVDGFRLDAVPYLFEREGTNCENLPETHSFLKKLREHVDKNHKGKMLLAEANMWPEDSASYFGDGDECHMNYHFPIMPRLFMSVKMEDRYPITDIIDQTPDIPETSQWAMFLRNHDELTLEMVTDEERDYMYKVFTKDPQARINLGIRHRLAPLLDNNRKKIELLNVLLFSLPGTPVLYYGDEIGMGDNYYLGDRDGVRTPMQWSPDRNAGFSKCNPQKLYLPVILDPEYSYEAVNVENQQKNLSSLLWWMKRVINMRKKFRAFGWGDMIFLKPSNAKILAFTRTYKDETILVVANLSRYSQSVELDIPEFRDHTPVEVFSQNKFPKIEEHPYLFTLGPHGYFWFQLQKEEHPQESTDNQIIPEMEVNEWSKLFKGKNLSRLESKVIPEYMAKCRWFGGKGRKIQRMQVVENISLPFKESVNLLIVQVNYIDGLPEFYQLPVSFAKDEDENYLKTNCPVSVIANLTINGQRGIFYDALFGETIRNNIFKMMARKKKVKTKEGELVFSAGKDTVSFLKENKNELSSKVLAVEQSNSSVIYDKKFFMKFYRKLDEVINPDVEVSRFLTEKAGFKHIPRFIGSIENHKNRRQPMVLGMMLDLVPNQGDAWEYTNDSIRRYYDRVLTEIDREKVPEKIGSFSDPVDFTEMPEDFQQLIGGSFAENVSLLGKRTAEMHLALLSKPNVKDFEPENFSLHYQRSLYSSLVSLLRTTFDNLDQNLKKLPDDIQEEAKEVRQQKKTLQKTLQKIYSSKIDSVKIRNHGDYHLGQVLYTGKDFMILDFEGEPARPFSERRLKRSPLRDVAGMLRSFHYAAYGSLYRNDTIKATDLELMEQWAEVWYHYVSGLFMKAYLDTAGNSDFIPKDQESFKVLVETFLLEKAIYELNYELNNRPDWVKIPVKGIKSILQSEEAVSI